MSKFTKIIVCLMSVASYSILAILTVIFSAYIVSKYIVEPPTSWNLLPNLGKLYYPALFMYIHIVCGFIMMICGLIQILPIFRRKSLFIIHRIVGTIICLLGMIICVFGNMYIYTEGTVGGINMDIAFSVAGWLMGFLSVMTYYYARQKNKKRHKDWALRLFSQIYASLFYRLSYFVVIYFGYTIEYFDDFYRPLDKFLDWWFFLAPLLLMEIYIWGHKINQKNQIQDTILLPLTT